MQLFYNPEITINTQQFTFDKIESKHIIKVLRKKESDILHITNGKGVLFEAKILIANDKKCLTEIIKFSNIPNPRKYYLHVAIAPTKNNDRLEWFLEKATEIGIDEITPIICDNSERKIVKKERYKKIIQSAMKQSLKYELPQLNDPIKFADFIKETESEEVYIAHCENQEKKLLQEICKPNTKITILIGPEGDFSKNEIKNALEKNIIPISLGASRLRTETAGLVAVNTVSFINQ